MQTMAEMVNDCIDEMDYSEFQSVVSVCESLIENYEKAYQMDAFSGNNDCSQYYSFMECFVTEESIWRKEDENGKKEALIKSIILLPIRLIQAFVKLVQRIISRNKSDSLDKKLNKIEELAKEGNLKKPQATAKKVVKTSTSKEADTNNPNGTGSVETSATITASGKNVNVEINIDYDRISRILDVAYNIFNSKEDIDKLNEALDQVDVGNALTNIASHGKKAKNAAEMIARELTEVIFRNGRIVSIQEFEKAKNKAMKKLSETEKACSKYKSALEKHLNKATKSNADDKVIKELTESCKDTTKVIRGTADMVACIDASIAACNAAADEMINGKDNKKETKEEK